MQDSGTGIVEGRSEARVQPSSHWAFWRAFEPHGARTPPPISRCSAAARRSQYPSFATLSHLLFTTLAHSLSTLRSLFATISTVDPRFGLQTAVTTLLGDLTTQPVSETAGTAAERSRPVD
jgi:hypothetical protein